jgi:hypothetical protein
MNIFNTKISKLLNDSKNKSNRYLTNKTCRLIKKLFNQESNIIDHLFQGRHKDKSLIGSYYDDEKEIKMIYEVFNKATSLSIKKSENIINKWNINDINLLPIYQRLIIKGFKSYKENKNILLIEKVKKVELSKEIFRYYRNFPLDVTINIIKELTTIENQFLNEFKNVLDKSYSFNEFNNSLIFIIDNTMCMHGKSNEIALLYSLFMIKVFKLKKIYFMNNLYCSELEFSELDYKSSYLNLIKKIYRSCFGTCDFKDKLSIINKYNFINKNILFLTSSNKLEANPLSYIDDLQNYKNVNNNLIIMNLNENKFNIPYSNLVTKLNYINGNKLIIFINIIKILYKNSNETKILNKSVELLNSDINSIINNSIDEINITNLGKIPNYNNKLSDQRINELFIAYTKNIPPKITHLSLT